MTGRPLADGRRKYLDWEIGVLRDRSLSDGLAATMLGRTERAVHLKRWRMAHGKERRGR